MTRIAADTSSSGSSGGVVCLHAGRAASSHRYNRTGIDLNVYGSLTYGD